MMVLIISVTRVYISISLPLKNFYDYIKLQFKDLSVLEDPP